MWGAGRGAVGLDRGKRESWSAQHCLDVTEKGKEGQRLMSYAFKTLHGFFCD
jgi:hypothetical protein